jgi:release factor glutamine methyltransferase
VTIRHEDATLAHVVRDASDRFAEAGCSTPRVDAEWLLAHVLGTTRAGLRADGRRVLAGEELAEVEALVSRRERREPLAYVLGEWGFRRLSLQVDDRALVPRPETEIVVERCLAALAGLAEPAVLDVGTGSGAIALAIADEHPGARVTGSDVSEAAVALARENARRTALDVSFVAGDLHAGLPTGPWDLVVSNPPYVEPSDVEKLAPEVRDWEPRQAVVEQGATDAIARFALDVLRPGGALVLESAEAKAAGVAAELQALGYRQVRIVRDLAGRERVVEGVLP